MEFSIFEYVGRELFFYLFLQRLYLFKNGKKYFPFFPIPSTYSGHYPVDDVDTIITRVIKGNYCDNLSNIVLEC